MRTLVTSLCIALLLIAGCAGEPTPEPTEPPSPIEEDPTTVEERRQLIDVLERQDIEDERVLDAMRSVPRHLFVPADVRDQAYNNYPLPIGYGQTISQPYVVALMTELLELERGDRVLEVGTGSGYQAAVLAEMPGVEVYTMEIIPELAETACARLEELDYDDVHCRQGDGYYGWSEQAPFDAIIVTAAPDHLPQPLKEQLATEGELVIPIGPPGSYQTLWKFVKQPDGELQAFNQGTVRFVPLTGER